MIVHWEHVSVADGSEYFSDGLPECPLSGFILDPGHSNPVSWEWRSPTGEVIAEGFCPTIHKAKGEAETFIRSHLTPSPEEYEAARRSLLAVEADLSL